MKLIDFLKLPEVNVTALERAAGTGRNALMMYKCGIRPAVSKRVFALVQEYLKRNGVEVER